MPLFAPWMGRNIRPPKEEICAAAATSDGKMIATGSLNGELKLVSQKDRGPNSHLLTTSSRYPLHEFGPPVQTLELGQSGRVLICHREAWFSIVETASNSTHEAFQIGESRCHRAAYSDLKKIALLAFREPEDRERIVALRLGPTDSFTFRDEALDQISDSQRTAATSSIFENQFSSRIESLCLTADQSMFVVALRGGEVICLDTETGTEVARWANCAQLFRRVTLTAAGNQIISGSHDGWVRWHETKTGRILNEWQAHQEVITAIIVDLDRGLVYSATEDGKVRSSNVDGERQRQFVGHDGAVNALALSPDGSTLASGGSDHKAIVWDTVSGETQLTLDAHIGPVIGLFFGQDGCLYSTSHDHAVRVWGNQIKSSSR